MLGGIVWREAQAGLSKPVVLAGGAEGPGCEQGLHRAHGGGSGTAWARCLGGVPGSTDMCQPAGGHPGHGTGPAEQPPKRWWPGEHRAEWWGWLCLRQGTVCTLPQHRAAAMPKGLMPAGHAAPVPVPVPVPIPPARSPPPSSAKREVPARPCGEGKCSAVLQEPGCHCHADEK